MHEQISQEVLDFIKKSPSCFHATNELSKMLEDAGFIRLNECENWELKRGGKYFTTRNSSSIIAFSIGEKLDNYHFQLTSSHSDSPTFKIKENPTIKGNGGYIQLNTEGYGGMICSSWLDRPLSIAGRVLINEKNKIISKLIDFNKDLVLIPNLAIHLNREINNGVKYNNQIDMLPLFSVGECNENSFYELIADELNIKKENILSKDLYLYPRTKQSIWGAENEFISSPRLDDLQCAYISLKAFISSENTHCINVFSCFDNEEVGSGTKQGALSTFLYDLLQRINNCLNFTNDDYYKAIAKSFTISCDNAHAQHPNHPQKTDNQNCAYLNKGVVIKFSANQKYTTDAISASVFIQLCSLANVPYQKFINRSDIIGGSTLGNLSSQKVSMHTVDIGLAQLAMHSSYETAGIKDSKYMLDVLKEFYNTNICIKNNEQIELLK